MGGGGEKSIECAAEVCDGWAPWLMEWSKAKESIADIKRRAASLGRNPDALAFSLFEKSIPDESTLADMERAGVGRVILTILGKSRDEALPMLDQLAKVNG